MPMQHDEHALSSAAQQQLLVLFCCWPSMQMSHWKSPLVAIDEQEEFFIDYNGLI